MAATFDPELIGEVADAISTEGRAKYNKHVKYGDHDIFKGLTFWAPNINIFRDPRWGRGQETFGEDPFLTAQLGVSGVMGAYNRTNDEPCSAHSYLLVDVLRKKWNFDGYIVSDCDAVGNIYKYHKYVETLTEAAAVSLKNTCDLNCGKTYELLIDAYEMDLITEDEITAAAENLFTIRYLLGEFEEVRPYSDIGLDKPDSVSDKLLGYQCLKIEL